MPIWDEGQTSTGARAKEVATGGAVGAALANMDGASMNKMASEAKEMLKSARSGGFRVSEESAKPIREALLEVQRDIDRIVVDLNRLGRQEPSLGGHPYGQRVAEHQRYGTVEAPGSPAMVLDELRKVIADADKALEVAIMKYKETEESASDRFSSGQV
ncbi:hypothetical protein FFT09_08965 [Saccharomonospora piscinae]|uniref:hypothetical protein n=1 Tax=Saccharomonospora piscinae TaxID=687388 RepID=UPI00110707D2|nr:hypothetical protein [Saccharomonospora piscinae]TLW93511.1 hypothetical protein FFT09_08965 [Saccharomonospora piscinae]